MHELVAIALGIMIGSVLSTFLPPRTRAATAAPISLVAGLLAAALNGELHSAVAGIYFVFDALLVALGIAVATALVPGIVHRRSDP